MGFVMWRDRWELSLIFGGITCAFGAVVLTARSASTQRELKESKSTGIVLLISGTVFSLIELIDRFIVGYR